jgi:hypothetical protein
MQTLSKNKKAIHDMAAGSIVFDKAWPGTGADTKRRAGKLAVSTALKCKFPK